MVLPGRRDQDLLQLLHRVQAPITMVYGEIGRLMSNGGDAQVKSSVQGSLGVRVAW